MRQIPLNHRRVRIDDLVVGDARRGVLTELGQGADYVLRRSQPSLAEHTDNRTHRLSVEKAALGGFVVELVGCPPSDGGVRIIAGQCADQFAFATG